MGKCLKCGKSGLFFKVNQSGYCNSCADEIARLEQTKQEAHKASENAAKQKKVIVPAGIGNYDLKYKYSDEYLVGVQYLDDKAPFMKLSVGDKVSFVNEADNEYDKKAIKVIDSAGNKLGYLSQKSHVKDMVFDFLKKPCIIYSVVLEIDKSALTANLFVGFYVESETLEMMKASQEGHIINLTGNKNKEMQEMILLCSEGEKVTIEEDFDSDKGLVSSGGEIGYISASALSKINLDNYKAFINSIEADENSDKYKVSIIVFD